MIQSVRYYETKCSILRNKVFVTREQSEHYLENKYWHRDHLAKQLVMNKKSSFYFHSRKPLCTLGMEK